MEVSTRNEAPVWRDPFEIPQSLVPEGMTFQWCAKRADSTGERDENYEMMLDAGWVLVPQQWIPGGRPMINGNDLMCRPKWMTDNAKIENVRKAQKQIDDWATRWGGAEGFSGGVRTWTGNPNKPPDFKTIDELGLANLVKLSPSEVAAANSGTYVWDFDDPSGQNRFKKGDPIGLVEFARRKHAMQKPRFDRVPRHPWLRWLFNLISTEVVR